MDWQLIEQLDAAAIAGNTPMTPHMANQSFVALIALLEEYTAVELDQWDMWRFGTEDDPAYVYIGREPPAGYPPEHFDPVPTLFPET